MRLGALGGRHPFAGGERIEISVVEEIGVLDLTTGDALGPVGDRSVTVGQARLGLEASGVVPAGCECSLSSFVRAFARGDWGDGATGTGLELAAGVRFRNVPRRLGIDAGIRALAVHSARTPRSRAPTSPSRSCRRRTGPDGGRRWRGDRERATLVSTRWAASRRGPRRRQACRAPNAAGSRRAGSAMASGCGGASRRRSWNSMPGTRDAARDSACATSSATARGDWLWSGASNSTASSRASRTGSWWRLSEGSDI